MNNLHRVSDGQLDDKTADMYASNVFVNFAKYLVDFFRFSKIDNDFIKKRVTIEGRELLDEALSKKKGVIMLSSHIGNWELGGAVISMLGYPLSAIALAHKDEKVNNYFITNRKKTGFTVIPIGASLKRCFKVLKNNELLAILGDRDFSEKGEEIEFFGKKTLIPRGPAVFSLRTGAAIIPVAMVRKKDDKFIFICKKIIYPEKTGNEKDDILSLMKKYITEIEEFIKSYPDQWCVFRNVWNNHMEKSESLYTYPIL